MGVKGLYSYLRHYRRSFQPADDKTIAPLRIGVDAMSFFYRYKNYYSESFSWLDAMKANGHTIIFVFDGKPPVEKQLEVKERKDARDGAEKQAVAIRDYLNDTTLDKKERELLEMSLDRLEYQAWHLTREIRHAIQDALRARSIVFFKASQEADDVLSDLAKHKKIDVVLSTDMDFLLSGVQRLWIPQGLTMAHMVEEIQFDEVLREEGLTAEQFRDAAILCGVEPLKGAPTMPPKKAFGWMRHYGSLELIAKRNNLQFILEEGLLERVRKHFTSSEIWNSRIREDHMAENFEFLNAL